MSLIFHEGCDVSPLTNPPFTVVPPRVSPGRNSSFAMGTGGGGVVLDLGMTLDTVVVGFAGNIQMNLPSNDSVLQILDGSTVHLDVRVNSNGSFEIRRGVNGTLLGTSAVGLVQANAWFYLELKAKIDDTVGFAALRINGFTVINITNADTRNAGNASLNRVSFGGIDGVNTMYVDDMYVCSTAGALNNDFLGDVRVEAIFPNAAGQYTEWTPSAGNNWDAVNETGTPNDDTDYVGSGTVGQRDLYNFGSLVTAAGNVLGVKTTAQMKKTDTGTRGCVLMLRSGTTEVESPEFALNTSYARHESAIYETNPDTSAPFTISEVNALQLGVKVTT